jgi:hypothetical protein
MPRRRVKGKKETISYRDFEALEFVCRYGVVNREAVRYWAKTGRSVTLDRERRLREAGLIEHLIRAWQESGGRLPCASQSGNPGSNPGSGASPKPCGSGASSFSRRRSVFDQPVTRAVRAGKPRNGWKLGVIKHPLTGRKLRPITHDAWWGIGRIGPALQEAAGEIERLQEAGEELLEEGTAIGTRTEARGWRLICLRQAGHA